MYFGKNCVQKCFNNSKRTAKQEEDPREFQKLKPRNSQATHVH